MTREQIQNQVVELSKTHSNLVVSVATGVGKSLAALRVIQNFGGRWYIVVAETTHIKNWHDEIIKHGMQDLLWSIEIFCYDSLHKYSPSVVEGIILDEGHHAATELRVGYLSRIDCKHTILLTATLPTPAYEYLSLTLGRFHSFTYSLSQAIKDGIIPKPQIYLLGIELPEKQTEYVFKRGTTKKREIKYCTLEQRFQFLKQFFHIELHISCTEAEKYDLLDAELEAARTTYFNSLNDEKIAQSTKEFYKTRWLNLGSQRKRFIASTKTPITRHLLGKLNGKRLICFTGSVEQANMLAPSNNLIVNSYKTKAVNDQIISDFNEGRINELYATGMLREGINLRNIEAEIIIQLDNQTKSTVQMIGRALRADDPIVYILYIKGTRDEKYLETAFRGFNKDYLYYCDESEI